ncbi:MAG: 30S ribosomal protein S9 [Patescibacteria group bacterium]|nr:30S ribosomal protein S9 [Patescibacteria group bacterium]
MKQQKEKIDLEEEKLVDLPTIGKDRYVEGIGRRKRSTARVRLWDNDERKEFNILINDIDYNDYFENFELKRVIEAPLKKVKCQSEYKVTVKVKGGGKRGQADAIRLGLSRALASLSEEWKKKFRKLGFLTRDAREVERKKYGQRKARKEEQWQKR